MEENGTQTQEVKTEVTQEQQNNTPVAQPQTQVATAPVQQIETKQPGWFKRNWKKVAAGTAAVVTTVGSAIVAYRKGKQAGYSCAMPQDGNEYSPLDPNVE